MIDDSPGNMELGLAGVSTPRYPPNPSLLTLILCKLDSRKS